MKPPAQSRAVRGPACGREPPNFTGKQYRTNRALLNASSFARRLEILTRRPPNAQLLSATPLHLCVVRRMDRSAPAEAGTSAPSMVSETNDTAAARAEMHIEPSVVEGRQRIVIKHFSLLKNDVTEEFDSPEKFTLCGEEFNLRLYPGGFNDESRNYLGFYLKSHGNKQLWLAKSDYRIVNQKARPHMASADDGGGGDGIAARTLPDEVRLACSPYLRRCTQPLSLPLRVSALLESTQVKAYDSPAQLAPGKLYGYSMFIRRDKLLNEENGLCVNDTVIFETALTVISSWHTTSGEDGDRGVGASTRRKSPPAIAVQPPSWSSDMEALLGTLTTASMSHQLSSDCIRCSADSLMKADPFVCSAA